MFCYSEDKEIGLGYIFYFGIAIILLDYQCVENLDFPKRKLVDELFYFGGFEFVDVWVFFSRRSFLDFGVARSDFVLARALICDEVTFTALSRFSVSTAHPETRISNPKKVKVAKFIRCHFLFGWPACHH